MKRVFFTILLVLSLTVMLYAESADERPSSGFDYDIRFGISFPFIGNLNDYSDVGNIPFGSTLLALAFSSISIGGGAQYTIIPHLVAPGIYADLHFNLFSWFIVGAFTNWDYNFMLLQPGIRLYNQFQITKSFGIEPFYGINFIYIGLSDDFRKSIPLMNAGFVLKLGSTFGFEYCYNFPKMLGSKESWVPSIHRIGFSWSLR